MTPTKPASTDRNSYGVCDGTQKVDALTYHKGMFRLGPGAADVSGNGAALKMCGEATHRLDRC